MSHSVIFVVLILVVYGLKINQLEAKLINGYLKASYSAFPTEYRSKRTASQMIVMAVMKGYKAYLALVNKAKLIATKGKVRQYQKDGGYEQAVDDFYSVRPFDVYRIKFTNGAVGMRGRVGDRTIVVKSKDASGRPAIEILKTETSNGYPKIRHTDRIIYADG